MRTGLRLLSVGCTAIPLCALAAADVHIELLPRAKVDGGAVVLGQVAHLTSKDLALMQSLVYLPIGRAPRIGDAVSVNRKSIVAWIRSHVHPATAFRIVWEGPTETRVGRMARFLSGDQIAGAAERALRPWLAARSERYTVDVDLPLRDIEVPLGALLLKPRPLGAMQVRRRMVVWVDVWVADRFVRTVPVAFAVSAWRTAATAADSLVAGAPLNAVAARARETDLTEQDGAPLDGIPGNSELRARRSLRKGEVIRRSDVQRVPAVARGQWASLRTSSGVVMLESRAEVLQDGWTGDKVRVRPPGATGVVLARVLGPGKLEVTR